MRMNGVSRVLVAASLAAMLGGCGAISDTRGFTDAVMKSPLLDDDSSEKAMAALTRGDYPMAERVAIAALRRNPKDPYSLYVAGMVYQATGRYDLARQYYEVILANRPQVMITVPSQGGPQVRSLVDVAQANLLVVDKLLGRTVVGSAIRSGRSADVAPQQFEPMSPQGAARGMIAAAPLDDPGSMPSAAMAAGQGSTQAEGNVASRFKTLRRLLDEGLITPDEHAKRRNTNVGALLPYSAKVTPAQGLERPAPSEQQVVDRLRALAVSLETRALSPAEHAAERTAILDALLPAEPRRVEMPVLPPKDVMEAATAVGRVERLRAANLVSADEAKREKAAVEKVLDSQLARQPVSGTATGLRQGTNGNGAKASSGGGTPGVGLGTAKTEEAAHDTWEKAKAKFPEELGGLSATFPKLDQGERGTRWRIVAGPMKSRAEAQKLCKVLKLHRQACEATSY